MQHQQRCGLGSAAQPHIDSFNYIYSQGLQRILCRLIPMEISEKDIVTDPANKPIVAHFTSFKLGFTNLRIGKPYR